MPYNETQTVSSSVVSLGKYTSMLEEEIERLRTEVLMLQRRLDEIDKIATQPADPLNLSNRLEWLDDGMDAIHSIAAGEIDGCE